MFDERVLHPRKFTIHDQERKSTDVCCTIIGAIFALVMFIVACTMWNKGKSATYPRSIREHLLQPELKRHWINLRKRVCLRLRPE